ncbi:MAG: MerR family transcriptional regulator [Bacteroidales bacterium]|nr:MerR family transcriptional regulator [Bacteroidales bacterium]
MESKKLFYPIGEVSRMFDLPITTIRFWENNFSVLKPKKTKKGNRLFTNEDIENLKLIYKLVKEEGYTLSGAETRMKEMKKNAPSNEAVIQRLLQIRKELAMLKAEI